MKKFPIIRKNHGPTIRILAVGRLRTPHWQAAADYYLRRLEHWLTISVTCIPDGDAALSPTARRTAEANRILEALSPRDTVICLDERGTAYTSREFAALLARLKEDGNCMPCFVIGGPFGLTDAIRQKAKTLISFGPMTLPHELARIVLLEQLYRAESILRGLPYHHD